MTKSEIIAELRRSATEDRNPLVDVSYQAYMQACGWQCLSDFYVLSADDCRTFFLLVAEALETE